MNSTNKIIIGLLIAAAFALSLNFIGPKSAEQQRSISSYYVATTSDGCNVGGVLYPKALIASPELLSLQARAVSGVKSKDFSKEYATLAARVGHGDICAHSWSPDGKVLVLAHNDFSFDFIDVANKTVKTISNSMPHSQVLTQDFGIKRSGEMLLACTAGEAPGMWGENTTGQSALVSFDPNIINPIKTVSPLPLLQDAFPSITLSKDLNTALVSLKRSLQIWSVTKHSLLKEVVSDDLRTQDLTWSPDGTKFAFQLGSGVCVYSAAGKEIGRYFAMQSFQPRKVLWSENNKLTVVGFNRDVPQVIHLTLIEQSLILARCVNVPLVSHEIFSYFEGEDFQGFKLIALTNSGWQLWEEDSNDVSDIPAAFPGYTAAQFSPDGKYISLSGASTVEVFDSNTGLSVLTLTLSRFTGAMPKSQTVNVEWAPNSKAIIVLGDMYTGSVEIVPIP